MVKGMRDGDETAGTIRSEDASAGGSGEQDAEFMEGAVGEGDVQAEGERGQSEEALEGADGESRGEGQGTREEQARPRQPTYVETLERRLQETQDQLREYIQAYKKVKEDMEDFKRRLDREAQKDLTMLRGRLVTELLEVLDNLDRSVMGGESGWNPQAMLGGLKMVQGQFLEKLQQLGLEMIDPQGRPFDPNLAEALDVTSTPDPDLDNTVSRVYSRGYRLNDRVIRPARVQVARLQDES